LNNHWCRLTLTVEISDEMIILIVDKGINSLGNNPSQVLWSTLAKEYNIDKNQVAEKLPEFIETLQKVFGASYSFLDLLFLTLLQRATGERLEGHIGFLKCVTDLRNKVTKTAQTTKNEPLSIDALLSWEATTQEGIR
jgi:predicted metalloprotease with PDZ domain